MPEDIYHSIAAPSEGVYKQSGSRFIAYAFPVESEDGAKGLIASIRKEHHGARHHCYAYRIGPSGAVWRSSDDGEPSGSAGRVILGQIDSAHLSDVLIVVVRYFGGVLLGVPGLIKAYKTSSADAIAAAEVIDKTARQRYRLEFDYAALPQVMSLLKDMDTLQGAQNFAQECSLEAAVRLSQTPAFEERAGKIDNLTITKI